MSRIKRLLKKVMKKILIKLHILKRPEETIVSKREIPDFDLEARPEPEFVMRPGSYCVELDDCNNPKIAFQIHAFFLEVLDEIIELLNEIPYPYDCYVSTDTEEKKEILCKVLSEQCPAHYVQVDVMENRGRDVGPFLQQMASVIGKYKYIAHLHTKKSKHIDFGDDWRHFLYRNMFGGRDCMTAILEMFENDDKLGLVVPEVYPIVRGSMAWDNTRDDVNRLLKSMGLSTVLPERPMCPVGDIFWARTEAVKILFEQGICQENFQEEQGQINYTLAHVIERIWCYLVQAQGYDYKICINGMESPESDKKNMKRALIYQCCTVMEDTDYDCIQKLADCFDYVVASVNSEEDKRKLEEKGIADFTVLASGSKYEVWNAVQKECREVLCEMDEVAILDNSGVGPLYNVRQIMDLMTKKGNQWWSVFKGRISQSIFVCFNLIQLRLEGVSELMEKDAESDCVYVQESAYIGEWLFADDPINELAFDYIILHAPFITRKSLECARENEKTLIRNFFEKSGLLI